MSKKKRRKQRPEPPKYFWLDKLNEMENIAREIVEENESATPPTPPTKVGYKFIDWSIDFTNIQNNLVVVAQYKKDTTNDNINNNQLVYAGKGYGLTHKDYVGIAEIKVLNNIVIDLSFEEVYFPTHWAALSATEGVDADLFLTYVTSKGKEATVAKYIVVDGKKFTATPVEGDVKYAADGIADLKAACTDKEETAKWYAEALLAGKAFAAKAAATPEMTLEVRINGTSSTALQQKRLNLLYNILTNKGVEYSKINMSVAPTKMSPAVTVIAIFECKVRCLNTLRFFFERLLTTRSTSHHTI